MALSPLLQIYLQTLRLALPHGSRAGRFEGRTTPISTNFEFGRGLDFVGHDAVEAGNAVAPIAVGELTPKDAVQRLAEQPESIEGDTLYDRDFDVGTHDLVNPSDELRLQAFAKRSCCCRVVSRSQAHRRSGQRRHNLQRPNMGPGTAKRKPAQK